MLRNADAMNSLDGAYSRIGKSLDQLYHALRRNTVAGSRRNISAHYDLGNEFFSLFLDSKLMYSSAFYPSDDTSLEDAATAKLERICQKLDLKPGERVLEIGTGWGGFAIYAAKNYGCHVTTATISQEQYALAKQRVTEEGLENRVTLMLEDYRNLEGTFDKLVSIEMVEAVGHQFLDSYVKKCSELLSPNGKFLIQAITIADQHYESALTEVDFIKKYIFPGGFLPSVTAISSAFTRASDFKIVHLEDIGQHYARTLRDWRTRFTDQLEEIKKQGYPETFIRMWHFYFCYCEGSFLESYIATVQIVANKPAAKTLSFNKTIEQLS